MRWYHYIAYFFGGAFFANAVPHFTNGVSGRTFPSPFSSPPGQGPSSPTINVCWGTFNLVIGYLLVAKVGAFSFRNTRHATLFGLGWIAMAVMLSRAFRCDLREVDRAPTESPMGRTPVQEWSGSVEVEGALARVAFDALMPCFTGGS